MSRISRLRSMTLTLSRLLERLLLAGRELVVGDEDVEAGLALRPARAPRPCPCRRTSSGRRGDGSATPRRRRRRRPSSRGWRARPATPRRSSRRRRRCRPRRGTPSRRAGSRSIIAWAPPKDSRSSAIGRAAGRRTQAWARSRSAAAEAGPSGSVCDVEPGDVRLASEPRPLALGEGHVARDVLGDGLVERALAVEDGPRLAVADRGEGRAAPGSNRSRSARASSMQAGVELGRGAVRRSTRGASAGSTVEPDPGDRAVVAARRRQAGVAAELGDLEGPDDAPRVAQVDPRGRASARCAREALDERLAARRATSSRLEPRADVAGRTAARRWRGRGRPRAGTAPCRRRGSRPRRAAGDPGQRVAGVVARSRRRVNGSSGSTRSSP